MAQRRMFSLKVIDTDMFLDLSINAQLLYFHLAIRADDDGFISSPKKIVRMINLKEEDFNTLIDKGLIIKFESGVCVVKHWLVHNCIQKDRYCETLYLNEFQKLVKTNSIYELNNDLSCIQNDSNLETQGSLGLNSIAKDSKGKENAEDSPIDRISELYSKYCPNLLPVLQITDTRRKNINKLFETFSWEEIQKAFIAIGKSEFCNGKKGFKASIDFCINIDRVTSALEGKYDEHSNRVSFADLTSDFEEFEIIGGEIEND